MESRYLDKANPSKRETVCRFRLFKCILWPQWLAYAFSLQVSEGFEQRRRWCNLIKRQHGKDGISTVVSSEYFRKEDIRKT